MKTLIENLNSRWRWTAVVAVAGCCSVFLAGCGSSAPPKLSQEKVKVLESQLDPSQIKKTRAKGKGEDYISLRQRKKLMAEAAKKIEGQE
jgi:hypothetical protein